MSTETEICAFVVDKIIDDVLAWVDDESADVEEIKKKLVYAFKYEDDGFRVASILDKYGWDADAKLVKLLDDSFMYRAQAMRELAKEKADG